MIYFPSVLGLPFWSGITPFRYVAVLLCFALDDTRHYASQRNFGAIIPGHLYA